MNEKLRKAAGLYLYFFRIGWFTFGGGWSIVAQMQTDFVEKKKTVGSQELLDIVSVGRSLPGTMIGNVAYLFGHHFGHHQGGVLCGVMAVLGIVTPPLVILSVLTFFYVQFRDNLWVAKALTGIRAVVPPIILSAVLRLNKGAFPEKVCFLLCGLGCVLSLVWKVNCVFLVLFGAAAGLLLKRGKGREQA